MSTTVTWPPSSDADIVSACAYGLRRGHPPQMVLDVLRALVTVNERPSNAK